MLSGIVDACVCWSAEKRFVMRVHGENKVTVDKPWAVDFTDKRVDFFMPAHPLIIYHKPKECLWVNTQVCAHLSRFDDLSIRVSRQVADLMTLCC